MRVLVFAHRLEVGGTQLNAIELAATLRDQHHLDVVVFATPGPMLEVVNAKRLNFIAAPDTRIHPSFVRMKALRTATKQFKPDVIHAWDWWQGLEAYIATHLTMHQPIVVSDMMMELTRVLPKNIPTTFGIPALQRRAVDSGWRHAEVLLPPVDTVANAPGVSDGRAFRQAFGVRDGEVAVVSVSRLAGEFKAGPLTNAIAAVRRLGNELPLKLLIVGGGSARQKLELLASQANAALGRPSIVFTGPLLDPRPAYAAADILVGMGGSSLRGLAFGKPVIVVGKEGFAKLFSPENAMKFHDSGMYGGAGQAVDGHGMQESLQLLADDKNARSGLGEFGRNYVVRHHSLDSVALRLSQILQNSTEMHSPTGSAVAQDALRTTMVYLKERRFLNASKDRLSKDLAP